VRFERLKTLSTDYADNTDEKEPETRNQNAFRKLKTLSTDYEDYTDEKEPETRNKKPETKLVPGHPKTPSASLDRGVLP
jgi:hypothetical protein